MERSFYSTIQEQIDSLKKNKTYKVPRYITSSISGTASVEEFGDVIMLCSNNYLGLANNEKIIEEGIKALRKYGAGSASVRFICGTFDLHRKLERKIADFLNTEAALTYTSCMAANTGIIPTILGDGDSVISDELNHASLIDGCRLIAKGVKKFIYKHCDAVSLEEKIKEAEGSRNIVIVTDGVFSMEGDIAPLDRIKEVAQRYNAIVLVDDSHGIGVIGKTGRGTAEYYNLLGDIDIITGTFGKALGGATGGFITAKKEVVDLCFQRSRSHLFSNALPPVMAAVAISAIDYLDSHPEIIKSLKDKTEYFRARLKEKGFSSLKGSSAIIRVLIGDTAKAIQIALDMLESGVYVIGFGYPIVPEGKARIRFQVSDALSYRNIDTSINIFSKVCKKYL